MKPVTPTAVTPDKTREGAAADTGKPQGGTTQAEQDKASENRGAPGSPQDSAGRAKPGSKANPPESSGAGTPAGRLG